MKNIKHTILDILELLIIITGIFFGLILVSTQILEVNGSSMEPTLFTNEKILAEKISYALDSPKRYDIVIAKDPTNAKKLIVKRIIGLPNDILKLNDNHIYVNGKKLSEEYLDTNTTTSGNTFLKSDSEISIPNDEYFLLGDNREKVKTQENLDLYQKIILWVKPY